MQASYIFVHHSVFDRCLMLLRWLPLDNHDALMKQTILSIAHPLFS